VNVNELLLQPGLGRGLREHFLCSRS